MSVDHYQLARHAVNFPPKRGVRCADCGCTIEKYGGYYIDGVGTVCDDCGERINAERDAERVGDE